MKITSNAICDDRPVRIDAEDEYHSYWGSAAICCDACRSIAFARMSWGILYDGEAPF